MTNRQPLHTDDGASGDAKLQVDLRSLRTEMGLTLQYVAQECGIEPEIELERIERGHAPSLSDALRVSTFYDVPVEEMWGIPR